MNIFIEPLLFLLVLFPLLICGHKNQTYNNLYLIHFVLYLFLDYIITVLPLHFDCLNLIDLTMNWQGKINSYILAIFFLFVLKPLPPHQFGMTLIQNKNSIKFIFISIIGCVLFSLAYSHFVERYQASLEMLLFQLTMPSIIEEIVFRGIILGLLNKIYVKCYSFKTIRYGMGLIISSLLFGMWHGVQLEEHFQIKIIWLPLLYTSLIGFLLGLVREKTNSVLLPIVFHTLINTIPNLAGYIY